MKQAVHILNARKASEWVGAFIDNNIADEGEDKPSTNNHNNDKWSLNRK